MTFKDWEHPEQGGAFPEELNSETGHVSFSLFNFKTIQQQQFISTVKPREGAMSIQNLFSNVKGNKVAFRFQLVRIMQVFFILIFLTSAVGVNPAAAFDQLEVVSTTPDWPVSSITSKVQVLFNRPIDLDTFAGSIDDDPIASEQITPNADTSVLTIDPGVLEYEHVYEVVINGTVATADGLVTLGDDYTFSFTVESAVPVNDAYTTTGITTLSVNAETGVLANDPHTEGSTLTTLLVVGPNNGTLNLSMDGSFTFTPTTNWSGRASFTYQAVGSNSSKSAIVTITDTTSLDPIPGYLAQVSPE